MPQNNAKNPEEPRIGRDSAVTRPAESEEILFAVLEGINAGVYVADLATFEVIYANKYMREFFGDIVGKACWQTLQTGQNGPCGFCRCATMLRDGGTPGKTCSWIHRHTRMEKWFYIQDRSILWRDGRLVRLSVYTDISEQKEMAEALRKSREGLAEAQQIAKLGSWEWDLLTNKATWSDQLFRLMGYEPGAVEPSHEFFENMVHPDDLAFVRRTIERALKEKASYNIEFRVVRADGTLREVQSQGYPRLDEEGNPVSMAGITQDITDHKQAQRALRASKERAEAATKLKDKFLSLVAHDLRSPFIWMMGFLKQILKDTDHPVYKKHADRIEKILAGGSNMVHMIDDLLKISRIQTGKLVLSPRFMDPNVPINSVLGQFIPVAKEKGVEIANEIPDGGRLYADMELLRAVIQNLLSNAIKFSNRGDRITLFTPEGKPNTIAIRDAGTGMDREFMRNIFRHEVPTSRVGTEGETGTGMGLPLCRDIVRAHKGRIRVESRVGEGSVFYIELPHVRPKIVLVEDDEPTREHLKHALESLKADILEAEHGEEAMKILDRLTPHLIITDIQMPVMDGFTLMEKIRRHPKAGSVPVIALTAKAEMMIRERVIRAGADDFIAKNVGPEEFLLRVMKYVA